jgi:hypothetical protein
MLAEWTFILQALVSCKSWALKMKMPNYEAVRMIRRFITGGTTFNSWRAQIARLCGQVSSMATRRLAS